jgi:hypothetical protein
VNAEPWIAVTEAGMTNRFNQLQCEKAPCSIVASLDGRSNITNRRVIQRKKELLSRTPTKDGIAIVPKAKHSQNANDPISRR